MIGIQCVGKFTSTRVCGANAEVGSISAYGHLRTSWATSSTRFGYDQGGGDLASAPHWNMEVSWRLLSGLSNS